MRPTDLHSLALLVKTAQRLGYRRIEIRGAGGEVQLLLRNAEGVELTVQDSKQGLLLTSRHGAEPIQALVRAHTVEAVKMFLGARCQEVQVNPADMHTILTAR